jgi:hypothetical protein
MASSKLRAASYSSGVLTADALYNIHLCIPAKDLCRSRALCCVWRALTSDPFFAAAHKSRQTVPLLALAYHDNNEHTGVEIVDLSGNVLRRIPGIKSDIDSLNQCLSVIVLCIGNVIRAVPTHLDLVCFVREHR